MLIDLQDPWRVLPRAVKALRYGGVLVGYMPTVVQVKSLVDELRAHPGFDGIEVMENLHRYWHVKDLSVRPEHRMVAHTGFIIIARRVPEEVAILPMPREPKAEERPETEAQERAMSDEETLEVK